MTFCRDPATHLTQFLGVALEHAAGLFHQVLVQLGQLQTVGDLWGKVARAASAAKRASAKAAADDGGGDTEGSADTLAVTTAAAAAAAMADRQGDEGGAPDGEEDGSGSGGNWEGNLGSSNRQACLPQGHVLMRQASAAGTENASSSWYLRELESKSAPGRFLWFSEDIVGPKGCDLRIDEELILVRFKRLDVVILSLPRQSIDGAHVVSIHIDFSIPGLLAMCFSQPVCFYTFSSYRPRLLFWCVPMSRLEEVRLLTRTQARRQSSPPPTTS